MNLTLSVLAGRYAICRLDANDPLPDWAQLAPGTGGFISVTRTVDELSLVAP
jgi:hypothetical protein